MSHIKRIFIRCNVALLIFTATACVWAQNRESPIHITADLSDAPRKLFHADIVVPVKEGPLTLTAAKWIPGTHSPSGPASNIVGLTFTADRQKLTWRRDDVDLYQFHVEIPKGATTLHVHLDAIVNNRDSDNLAALEWEELLLYPANIPVRAIPIQAAVIVPDGWGIGTALTPLNPAAYPFPAAGSTTEFTPTNVEQLEDTPILTGRYFHEFPLAPDISPKHYIDVASDEPGDSNLRPVVLTELSNLVREAHALYSSYHYNQYHFLLTLSDVTGGGGLEHGQSSDNGAGEKAFADDAHQIAVSGLLPHEYTHSWNGKYRRPVGLYQPDFATPQQGALLWVYEGMTRYLGNMVLATRSGLRTQAQFRDYVALSAAGNDYQTGREWRPTEDTAVGASLSRGSSGQAWANWRRGADYYQEGELLWLDVDTLIRKQTDDRKSLDDFERIFLAKGGNTGPKILPYTFDELVATLNQVAPYDWASFFQDHVYKINPHADLDGIERAGYKLVYTDKPNDSERIMAAAGGTGRRGGNDGVDVWYSLGIRINGEGEIIDVRWNSPADKARLVPGQKIIAIDGRIFSGSVLRSAIRDAKGQTAPISLIVQSQDLVFTSNIDYHGGEQYPALERIPGTPDLLTEIVKPLVQEDSK